jgi:hypothetical protein
MIPDPIEPVHDLSRVDAYAAARRRALLLGASWRPMLAGAIGAALVIAAVAIAQPKFVVREIEVPRVTMKDIDVPKVTMRDVTADHVVPKDVEVQIDRVVPHDVPVDRVVPHDVQIDVPRLVQRDVMIGVPRVAATPSTPAPPAELPASPAPRSPQERGFVQSEGWREAVVRGRILREDGNGFVLATGEGEQSFHPAKFVNGKVIPNPSTKDVVAPYLGDLAYCRLALNGVWRCTALHGKFEVQISQTPIGSPL